MIVIKVLNAQGMPLGTYEELVGDADDNSIIKRIDEAKERARKKTKGASIVLLDQLIK